MIVEQLRLPDELLPRLPDGSPPYQYQSVPSFEAARRIAPALGRLKRDLLTALRHHGALSDEDMQRICEMNPSTQRPRRVELVRDGLVRKAGTSKNGRGRTVTLWEATA